MDPTPEICGHFARSRRNRGLTQSELAAKVSCKQSAISMFERGNRNALSAEKQKAIASLLDISWSPPENAESPPPTQGYCPNFDCPTNYPYRVANQLFFIPHILHEYGSRYCTYCGEILENACPNCSISFANGACCKECGCSYITIPQEHAATSQTDWVREQRKMIEEFKKI